MMDYEQIHPSYIDYDERAFMVGVLGNLKLLKKMAELGYDVLKVDYYNPENTVSSYYYENKLFSEKVYEVIAGPKGSYKIHLDDDYNCTIILELPIVKQYHNLLKRLGKKHLSKIDHFLLKFKYNIGYVDQTLLNVRGKSRSKKLRTVWRRFPLPVSFRSNNS